MFNFKAQCQTKYSSNRLSANLSWKFKFYTSIPSITFDHLRNWRWMQRVVQGSLPIAFRQKTISHFCGFIGENEFGLRVHLSRINKDHQHCTTRFKMRPRESDVLINIKSTFLKQFNINSFLYLITNI